MFKKTLLSTLLAISTIASAQINLDLDLTISNNVTERNATSSIAIDESVVTPVVFNGLESLVINFVAEKANEEIANIQAQLFQQTENEELIAVTESFEIQVPFNQAATVTVNETNGEGSLVLVVTPSLVE